LLGLIARSVGPATTRGFDFEHLDWLTSFVAAYADWTAKANGAGFESRAKIDNRVDDWNSIFFSHLANAPRV
jgi:hypothetical protein